MDLMRNDEAIKAEQSVLGAVFIDPAVIDEISFLEPRDFTGKHQQIYQVMQYLNDNDKPIDLLTVTTEYVKFGRIEEMGGVGYLSDLAASCPTSANAKFYADIVRSHAIKKRGISAGREIERLSLEDYETDDDYFSEIERVLDDLKPSDTGKMRSLVETRKSYFEHLKKKAEFIPTGFRMFDEWSNGLGRGTLFVSAGRPSVGKTAKLLQRSIGVAKNKTAGSVLIFSQEMDEEELKDRMISHMTSISFNRIMTRRLSDDDWAKIEEAYEKLEDLPIYIQDTPNVTIEEIRATARAHRRKHGRIAMIAVDYLQIMHIPVKKGETRSQAIGEVTKKAKQLARELNCCFMMLSQMTRESEKEKKPQLSHLRESGSIEQDADVVEFLWFDPNDYEPNARGKIIQQFIAKGRNIGINQFRLEFQGWRQNFNEIRRKSDD